MPSEICSHKDVRTFGDTLCCFSCGQVRNVIDKKPDVSSHGILLHPSELSLQAYEYTGLKREKTQIRLVAIFPGVAADPICCRIIVAELQSLPEYTAASYTWATETGDSSKLREIYVATDHSSENDKRLIKVTRNCESTLKQLRLVNEERTVWIDAVCIDQSDVDERSHQVRLMDRIYESAVKVEICIETLQEDYTGAIFLLNRSYLPRTSLHRDYDDEVAREHDSSSILERSQKRCMYRQRKYESAMQSGLGHDFSSPEGRKEAYKQLAALFELSYFSRVWVVQEVLFARTAILHINNHIVPLTGEILEQVQRNAEQKSIAISRLSHWVSIWNRNTGIFSCLTMSLGCSASDPRDQIYAITSLLQPHIRDMIKIDYQLDLQAVYMSAIVACIAECGDLDLLVYATLPANANTSTASTFGSDTFKKFVTQRNETNAPVHSVTRMRSPWLPRIFVKHRPTTKDTGHAIPTTHDATNASPVEILDESVPKHQFLPRMRVRAHLLDIISSSSTHSIADTLSALATGPEAMTATPQHSWLPERFRSPFTDLYGDAYDTDALNILKADLLELQSQDGDEGSAIFRTHYTLGCSKAHLQLGDSVWAIDGAQHLLVLRAVGDRVYRIVGTCYLWEGLHLDYWNPGSFKGIWTQTPFDLGTVQTRRIEVY
jgi:hypothetical protein